jgi:WD40 repeat protein
MDESLNIWRLSANGTATPKLMVIPTLHSSNITQLGFNQDSTRLVTTSLREIITWDISDPSQPSEISTLVVDENRVYRFAFDATSGDYVYQNGFDGTGLQLADADTGEVIRPFQDADTSYHSLVFSPDGNRLFAISWNHEEVDSETVFWGQVIAWDVETGDFLGALTDRIDELAWLAFSPDGSLIVGISSVPDVGARIFDAATGEALVDFEATGVPLFNADGSRLFIENIGMIDVWGLPDND